MRNPHVNVPAIRHPDQDGVIAAWRYRRASKLGCPPDVLH